MNKASTLQIPLRHKGLFRVENPQAPSEVKGSLPRLAFQNCSPWPGPALPAPPQVRLTAGPLPPNIDFLSLGGIACDTETDGLTIVPLALRKERKDGLSAQWLRSRWAKKTKRSLGSHGAVSGLLFCLSVLRPLPRPIWV